VVESIPLFFPVVKNRYLIYIYVMKPELPEIKYCPECGGGVRITFVEGRERPVCDECGRIIYLNPVPAACLVLIDKGKVLLTERAVEPQKGMWCLPGGFLEWGENPYDGGKRELLEETGINAREMLLSGVYDSVTGKANHVLLIAFNVRDWAGTPVAGDDASDLRWFGLEEMPVLAFKVHEYAIRDVLVMNGKNDNTCG
jgi:ADP-ribose pyrophosphatase YjhB (NUDIX family)